MTLFEAELARPVKVEASRDFETVLLFSLFGLVMSLVLLHTGWLDTASFMPIE